MAPRKPKEHKFVVAVSGKHSSVAYYLNGKQITPCGLILNKDKDLLAALAQYGIELVETSLDAAEYDSLGELSGAEKDLKEARAKVEKLKARYDEISTLISELTDEQYEIEDSVAALDIHFSTNITL